jgi:hypothetical protein
MKKIIKYYFSKRPICEWAFLEGIEVKDIKGTLHPEVKVSERYWDNQLKPYFYKEFYKTQKSFEEELEKPI